MRFLLQRFTTACWLKDVYRSAGEGRPTFPEGHRYEFMWRVWEGSRQFTGMGYKTAQKTGDIMRRMSF